MSQPTNSVLEALLGILTGLRTTEAAPVWVAADEEANDAVRGFVMNQEDLYTATAEMAAVRCVED